MRHLFLTQDYPPKGGGMARRHVELCRRLGEMAEGGDDVVVSTVAADAGRDAQAAAFDAGEQYIIVRQPFPFRGAKTIVNQARWARWVVDRCRGPELTRATSAPRVEGGGTGGSTIIHCGNVRPAGYPSWWAHRATGVPYLVYVYGGDLLREQRKVARSPLKRWTARRIFEESAGVVAISEWSAGLASQVMRAAGVRRAPRVLINELGTDPTYFRPSRNTGELRRRLGLGDAPLLLTVSRLVPHKGIDVALRAMASLVGEWPRLRYLVVGDGEDRPRLTGLATQLGLADRVVFAGGLSDDEVADAYATADVYVGLSRVDAGINAEGFGIAFVEAAASGVPSVAGDSGGVRSSVRDGQTGLLVQPTDVAAAANAIGALLANPDRRHSMGRAGRLAVETHYNWDRVARDVRAFALEVTSSHGATGSGSSV